MSSKDYYVILGISRTEAPAAIRSAYRDLAHRYHPDLVGPEGTAHFQEINEAYEVLSDPSRRAAYDRETGESSPRASVEPIDAPAAAPARRAGPAPEPMIADRDDVSPADFPFAWTSLDHGLWRLALDLLIRANRR